MATTSTNAKARTALRQMRHRYKVLPDTISATNKNITSKIADVTIKTIDVNYKAFIDKLGEHDHQDHVYTIHKEKEETGYRIILSGSQVLYDEFGTGTEGLDNPHPEKDKYSGLNPYLSGDFNLSTKARPGDFYWTYYSAKKGDYTSTFGVEAGAFVYKSYTDIADNVATNIATKEIQSAIKKAAK